MSMAKRKSSTGRGTFIQQSRSESPEMKAMYHAVLGAGKGRVVRDFFDVSAADREAIADRLQASLDARIARSS